MTVLRVFAKAFLSAVLALLAAAGMCPVSFAAEEMPVLKVAMSEDESIIVERILYTALDRLGFQMVTKTAGMRTTVNDVNYGEAAIVPAQTLGLDLEYPNLVRVPVPISYVETNVYARTADQLEFNEWGQLAGLRLSHCWKNLYVTRNVPRANASKVVTLNEYEDLWESLLSNQTDVSVIPNLTGYVRIVPEGIEMAGVIEREPRYTYLNKEYEHLVPLLAAEYQAMTDDGTMEHIRGSQQQGDKQIVLHISSYSAQMEWERSEIDAIRKSLELNPDLEYQYLNLNARQIRNKANINSIIANTIRTNFIDRNPDVIIASDNDALEFVLNNYYMLFPKTPVVFCGVNGFDISMLHGFEDYITGVTEYIPFLETVEEMLSLYPNTRRIFVLNDDSHSGQIWRESIEKDVLSQNLPVEVVFNEDKPFAEILEDISGLDSQTLVLLGTYFLDSSNAFYSEREVQESVCGASKGPVFTMVDSFAGYGPVGGMVSVGDTQGSIAGAMARDILGGTPPSQLPIVYGNAELAQWQFDYKAAERFGIDTRELPDGHVVIDRDLPIWESNPFEFRLALTGSCFLLVVIIGLAVFLRLMRQKNLRLMEIQSHLHSAEELLQKDADLRKMIDSLPVSVLIVDVSTSRPVYGNQAFLMANGLGSLEEAGLLDLSLLISKVFQTRSEGEISFSCGSLRQPDSGICQKISAEQLMYDNRNCLVLISEDITAQIKENELLARAAQKEKEANMLKSIFLANMSHEIRTPMNAIIGLSQLALIKQQTPENENFFYRISSSAKNLLSIINDILDFSKIEAEKIDLVEERFDLEDTISNSFMVAVDHVEDKPLEILLDMEPDVPCILYGDSTRLWQVLKNVLDNAVKYTKAGQVTFRIEVKESDPRRATLLFRIRDTGIGMAEDQLARLFTPFEQVHQSDFKSKKPGTGLGMSITKQLVNLMHGHIEVTSEFGEGTEFFITLPFVLPSDTKTLRQVMLENAKRQKLQVDPVLLLDKNPDALRVMSALLENIGLTAATASSCQQAVEIIDEFAQRGEAFRTVVIDYSLGDENGLEVAKQLRARNSGARLILSTAYLKQLIKPQLLSEADIEDVIEKPFLSSVFIQKVCGVRAELLQKQPEQAKYTKARILLCEDNDINQIVASGMLSEFGIEPMIAENGREALKLLEKHTFDLIFMDIIMPVMDGHEATIAIRKSGKPYSDTPICSLTANVMVEETEQCRAEGINAQLEKPLSIEALAAVLAELLPHLTDK